ncbi:MAG: hypothetical protein K9L61_00780 [Candidatus Omnitrophica bacterium]|nr:hypothetical protein [Candidatus Omnitrophota bacterium]
MKKIIFAAIIIFGVGMATVTFCKSIDINKIAASPTVREEAKEVDKSLEDFVLTGLFPTFVKT